MLLLILSLPLAGSCVRTAESLGPPPPPAAALVAPPADPTQTGPYPVGVLTRRFERRSSTTGEPRVLETVIWYPAAESARAFTPDARLRAVQGAPVAAGGPFPVLVFSHGANSSPIQSTFLTAHLASHGFVVAAPSHPGSTIDDCVGCGAPAEQAARLRDAVANRPDDVSFTLDMLAAMSADPTSRFQGAFDTNRAGALGHSWGGYTAVMAAIRDPRIRAAVAMAPVLNDTLEQAAPRLHVPVLVMGGKLDDVTPYRWQEGLYGRLSAAIPRYLLTFPLGGHTAYSEVCPPDGPGCRPGELGERAHPLVNAFTVSFLRIYLLSDQRYTGMLTTAAGGALLELTVR